MKYLLALGLYLAFNGCHKTELMTPQIKLPVQQCIDRTFDTSHITLCLDSLSDSRCPVGATCVWQGDAVLHMRLQGASTHQFTMSAHGLMHIPNDTTIERYRVQVIDVLPYPGSTTGSGNAFALVNLSRQ